MQNISGYKHRRNLTLKCILGRSAATVFLSKYFSELEIRGDLIWVDHTSFSRPNEDHYSQSLPNLKWLITGNNRLYPTAQPMYIDYVSCPFIRRCLKVCVFIP